MNDMYGLVSQNNRVQSILLNDSESGSTNKAPKLMTLDDYPHWKSRFETHLNGVDTNLWVSIEVGYTRPQAEN